ncbi:cytoplasmic dynein 2 light intermediate chain 1 [Paragonimus heterotremus]|uniref:Cytoplasmic dynein 2 light intermediate chain 1 n=1 Tax=Paragonimus heterotremus TaxID=100268 RepID=A0A8J4STJ3_9TREM|nr:cytoplasmic dynein 2 light intermediate chain 1 [Paragonimus heterotremus]
MTQSVWDIAIQQNSSKQELEIAKCEPTLLFAGNRRSGKTTIIHRLLEKDDKPKPTLALEYSYGRKAVGAFPVKSVVHIWELGGGTSLADLVDMTISTNSMWNFHMVLVLDISNPHELWKTMDTLLDAAKRRYEQIVNRVNQRNLSHIRKKLRELALKRSSVNHPDIEVMDPFPLPLIIIGSKYDLFACLQSEQQKVICKTLRFLSHYYSASLYFISSREESLMKKIKTVLSHVAFGTAESRFVQMELNKPLAIPEGTDSFSSIGAPPNIEMEVGRLTSKTPLEMWKAVFCAKFPQTSESGPLCVSTVSQLCATVDPAKDPQYAEPLVDAARLAKDEELERTQRRNERRMRELLQQVSDEGLLIV